MTDTAETAILPGGCFVARGKVTSGGDELNAGDVARLTQEVSVLIDAGAADTEVLIWETA